MARHPGAEVIDSQKFRRRIVGAGVGHLEPFGHEARVACIGAEEENKCHATEVHENGPMQERLQAPCVVSVHLGDELPQETPAYIRN